MVPCVWIYALIYRNAIVAPYVGTWIEMSLLLYQTPTNPSLPAWERGLKWEWCKNVWYANLSLLAWERWLKYRWSVTIHYKAGRSLHRSVDWNDYAVSAGYTEASRSLHRSVESKRIFTIRFATCRIIRDPPASGSFLMIFHNRAAASQLIRSCLYHSWYKQVPTHCLLLRAIEAEDLLDSVEIISWQ